MTDQKLETRLARELAQAAPNDLEGVLSRCQEQNGKVIPMTKTKAARPIRWRALIAACLALVLVGGGAGMFYQNANAVTSVVSIDVNPSIELRVNRDGKVLSCTPLNEEAHIALEEMNDGKDLEGAKLTVAVNAIVGALVRHGYLDGLSSAILVSVEDRDQARAQRMEEELRSTIGDLLEAQAPNATLLSQTLTQETGNSASGSQTVERVHPISSGKAALVNQILAMSENTEPDAFDKLAALTVEELGDLLETNETRIPIGKSAACWAAQEYAGTLVLSSNVVGDVDPELDKRPAYYEVELVVSGQKYEYKVDAFTGEVISGQNDILFFVDPSVPETSLKPVTTPKPDGLIGEEAAWATVCTHAGCALGDLSYSKCELDYENGVPHCYELEFCWNGNQYDYEIDCYTGGVLKQEWEVCDEEHHIHHASSGNVGTTVPPAVSTPPSLIGENAAWTAVCGHAGCALGDLSYSTCELDYEDGVPHCYELEFCWNGNQYEYEIDCYAGTVLKHEWEVCDEAANGHHGGTVTSGTGTLVGEDAAWTAACGHVGCGMGAMSYAICELDQEDGVYELEFCWQGNQYECEVDCYTGAVLQCEWETCHNGLHNCGGGGRHHGWGHH